MFFFVFLFVWDSSVARFVGGLHCVWSARRFSRAATVEEPAWPRACGRDAASLQRSSHSAPDTKNICCYQSAAGSPVAGAHARRVLGSLGSACVWMKGVGGGGSYEGDLVEWDSSSLFSGPNVEATDHRYRQKCLRSCFTTSLKSYFWCWEYFRPFLHWSIFSFFFHRSVSCFYTESQLCKTLIYWAY